MNKEENRRLMEAAVRSVLAKNSKKGNRKRTVVFDSHFVITQLKKHHHDICLHFVGPNESTAQMHGKIALTIERMVRRTGLAKQLRQYTSLSETIHNKPGKCALWQFLPAASKT